MKVCIYRRVSTKSQEDSGLSLLHQEQTCLEFANKNNLEVIGNFSETASGADNDRPGLQEAMALCRRHDARLLISKLTRLSRRVSFVAGLLDAKVSFFVAEWGFRPITNFEIHLYASFSELERSRTSQRVVDALSILKARGVKLGSPIMNEVRIAGNARRTELANEWLSQIAPLIQEIEKTGVSSNSELARCLNRRGIKTRRGNHFHPATVHYVKTRLRTLSTE
jgi:DNA invertase Pin-like site-specific DNA recombinase